MEKVIILIVVLLGLSGGAHAAFKASNDAPITAQTANQAMLRGVNFGNIFDQCKHRKDGTPVEWGAAWDRLSLSTLKKMVELYHDNGIRQFRMPFTWRECMDAKTGNLDKEHPKFIKYNQLLAHILDTYPDVYLIVNTHHDPWYDDWTHQKVAFHELWKDIATFYRDASYRVILEVDNEPFHGLKSKRDHNGDVREMMKIGWETIRNTGGRNRDRLIMLTPDGGHFYNLVKTYSGLKEIDLITGGKNDHAIMTVHFYDPWSFTGYGSNISDKSGFNGGRVKKALVKLSKWSEKTGVPVNVGELGVAWRYAPRYHDKQILPEMSPRQVEWYRLVFETCLENKLSFAVWDDNGWYRMLNRETLTFQKAIDALSNREKKTDEKTRID